MNSVILEELQKIIDTSGGETIPQKNVNQLLLASLVSLMQAVTEIDRKIDAIRDVSEELTNLRKEVRDNYVKKSEIQGNLAYRVGEFVTSKPKAATTLFVTIVLTALVILGYVDAQALRLALAHIIGISSNPLVVPIP